MALFNIQPLQEASNTPTPQMRKAIKYPTTPSHLSSMKQRHEIWIGTAEVRPAPSGARGAFVNITTWASNYQEFSAKAKEMLAHYGWNLAGIEQAEPVSENCEFSEEIEDMIERTRANPNAVLYGRFHTYPRDEA